MIMYFKDRNNLNEQFLISKNQDHYEQLEIWKFGCQRR